MAAAARILTRAAALSQEQPPEGECSLGNTGAEPTPGSSGAEPALGSTGVPAASATSRVRGSRTRKS
jgi:hypothetical protein